METEGNVMKTASVWTYFTQSFSIFFKTFLTVFFPLLFYFVLGNLALGTIVLAPFVIPMGYLVALSIIEKRSIDFGYIMARIHIKWDRYFLFLVSTAAIAASVGAGFILLVIPGIVLFYSLRPVLFILTTQENATVNQAFEQSLKISDGHRLKMFGIDAIFLVLAILLNALYIFLVVVGRWAEIRQQWIDLGPVTDSFRERLMDFIRYIIWEPRMIFLVPITAFLLFVLSSAHQLAVVLFLKDLTLSSPEKSKVKVLAKK
jgi:hypothetical protein